MKVYEIQKYVILILVSLIINYTWDLFITGGLASCDLNVKYSGIICFGMAIIDTILFILLFIFWNFLNNFGVRNIKTAFRSGYFLSVVLVIVLVKEIAIIWDINGRVTLEEPLIPIIYFILSFFQFSIISIYTFGLVKQIENKFIKLKE